MLPIQSTLEKAATEGLRKGGREILAEAKRRVPVDDGVLRDSGGLSTPSDGTEVHVTFNAPHAWLQHEKTEYQHPDGGQSKYLESAALEYDLAKPIADHVRAVLGG
jgi:hypothetical protein